MIMITKNNIKKINSLAKKKHREQLQLFVVEGYKSILEFHESGLTIEHIYVTPSSTALAPLNPTVITDREMKTISNLTTPPGYLAIVAMPASQDIPDHGMFIALDGIQDPGNMGTILRLADWFNIKHVLCNHGTVDLYNPKCIQATMGSLARVHVHYVDLEKFLSQTLLPVMVTTMGEKSLYDQELPQQGILVLGSESHGISPSIITRGNKISIPQYGSHKDQTESLNVATAAAIVMAEWRRTTGM